MSTAIGFVGLGTMGFPMAVNLKKAGFDVIGYDAFKGVHEKAASAGITMVDTTKEVAERADEAIISMVRDHAQNVEIIFGEDGLLSAQPQSKTIIVMSTLDPATMNELGEKIRRLERAELDQRGGKRRCFRCSSRHPVDHDCRLRRHRQVFPALLRRDGIPHLLLWRKTREQPGSKIGQQHDSRYHYQCGS